MNVKKHKLYPFYWCYSHWRHPSNAFITIFWSLGHKHAKSSYNLVSYQNLSNLYVPL